MKHIKPYKTINIAPGNYYWTIKSLPEEHWNIYAKKLLQKINCPENTIKEFIPSIKRLAKHNAFYIFTKITPTMELWDFTKIFANVEHLTNLGEITLNDKELEEINLEITANNYNL